MARVGRFPVSRRVSIDRTVRGATVETCHPCGAQMKAGTGARTSETSTTHVRSLMCLSGMRDSTHFLIRAIASWSGGQGGVPR